MVRIEPCWVFGANLRIVMSSIMRRRNGLMASSVMGMLLSDVRLATPHLQTGRAHPDTGRAACRSALPRERFSPLALFGSATCCVELPLSGKSGLVNSMIGAECGATACSRNDRYGKADAHVLHLHEADRSPRRACPLSVEQRKTFARSEFFAF